VAGAQVVVTAGPIVRDPKSPLVPEWLGEGSWLLLPLDFDFYASADVVAAADLFVTDDVAQFETYRSPRPLHRLAGACGVGRRRARGRPRREAGRCLQSGRGRARRGVRRGSPERDLNAYWRWRCR
jgi:hypothetical protein